MEPLEQRGHSRSLRSGRKRLLWVSTCLPNSKPSHGPSLWDTTTLPPALITQGRVESLGQSLKPLFCRFLELTLSSQLWHSAVNLL